jgi:hypothetical protein
MDTIAASTPAIRPVDNPTKSFWLDFEKDLFYKDDSVSFEETYDTVVIGSCNIVLCWIYWFTAWLRAVFDKKKLLNFDFRCRNVGVVDSVLDCLPVCHSRHEDYRGRRTRNIGGRNWAKWRSFVAK